MCTKFPDNIVTFNVSGMLVDISAEKLSAHPGSLLTEMVNNSIQPVDGFFIECCPKIFKYILRFILYDIRVNPSFIAKDFGSNEVRKVIDRFKFKNIYVVNPKSVEQLNQEISDLRHKVRFIKAIISKEIGIRNSKKTDIYSFMDRLQIPHDIYNKMKLSHITENEIVRLNNKISFKEEQLQLLK
jgi:BTB/POZ domain